MMDKKIIAYALKERRNLLNLKTFITSDYLHGNCKILYDIIISYFNAFKEVPTLNVLKDYTKDKWKDEFENIYNECNILNVDSRELTYDLEKLKLRYNSDLLKIIGKSIYKDNLENGNFKSLREANISVKKLSSGIDTIYNKKIFKEGSLSETVEEASTNYTAVKENPEIEKGVMSGFNELDKITNGIRDGDFVIIGGESSSGKSVLSMQMAVNAYLGSNKIPDSSEKVNKEDFIYDGSNILYFTIEMPFKQMRRRIDACLAGIPLYGIRDGNLTEEEYDKYQAVLKFQKLYKKQFHIVDIPRGCTVEQIENKYLEKSYEFNIDLIVVDYITLMSEDVNESDWKKIGVIAEKMHEFGRTYQIPVISPVQLNRPDKSKNNQQEEELVDINRVGRSLMLVQNCSIMLNIIKRKNENLKPDMLIQIAKMRDGEQKTFRLYKRFDTMRVFDNPPDFEPQMFDGCDV